ncbi:MAG: ligand-binding sensor domain-containing protein, partial [Flavobacteriales bacterium]
MKMRGVLISINLQLIALVIGGVFIFTCVGQPTNNKNDGGCKTRIPGCALTCGMVDDKDNLWFAAAGQGLYSYDGECFTSYKEAEALNGAKISSITQDTDGNIWLGTTNGLCRYDGKIFTSISIPWSDTSGVWLDEVYPIVNPNEVRCLLQDKNGMFWLGTNGAGVYRYNPNASGKAGDEIFTQFLSERGRKQTDGLHHNVIESMIEDQAGNIWFTSLTHGGVSRYDGKSFRHFMPEDGLSDDMVRSIFETRDGNIWIGTNGNRKGGLDMYNPKTNQF